MVWDTGRDHIVLFHEYIAQTLLLLDMETGMVLAGCNIQ